MFRVLISSSSIGNTQSTHLRKVFSSRSRAESTEIEWLTTGNLHLYRDYTKHTNAPRQSRMLFVLYAGTQLICEIRKSEVESIQIVRDKGNTHLLVTFINIGFSEQFHSSLHGRFMPLYVQDAIMIEEGTERPLKEYLCLLNDSSEPKEIISGKKWIQLPTCLTCLQKLEYELTGINSEHIKKQGNYECQLCDTLTRDPLMRQCQDCKECGDIWMCMICSRIGCGRYKNGDAYEHFCSSGHILTMELSTQRIWNYLHDCFSHRVVSPLNTLKIAEYEGDGQGQEWLEAVFWEYCSAVSEQLQRQRVYYEKLGEEEKRKFENEEVKLGYKIEQMSKGLEGRRVEVKKMQRRNRKMGRRVEELEEKCEESREVMRVCEATIANGNKVANNERIEERRRLLRELQEQIGVVLAELSA